VRIHPHILVMKKVAPLRERGLAAWAELWSVGVGSGRARQHHNHISRIPFQKKLRVLTIVESRADVGERTSSLPPQHLAQARTRAHYIVA